MASSVADFPPYLPCWKGGGGGGVGGVTPQTLQTLAIFQTKNMLVISDLAPAVLKADNAIYWINSYPAVKMYFNQYILSAG